MINIELFANTLNIEMFVDMTNIEMFANMTNSELVVINTINIELGDKTTTNFFHDSMRQRNTILMVTMFRQIREEFLGILQIK